MLATMSLTNHEEIGRVGRVGRGCYEKNCCRGIWAFTPVVCLCVAMISVFSDARTMKQVVKRALAGACMVGL